MLFYLLSSNSEHPTQRRIVDRVKQSQNDIIIITPKTYTLALPANQKDCFRKNSIMLHRQTGIDLDRFDLKLAQWAQWQGARISNPLNLLQLCRDKEEQTLFFVQAKLPHVPTLFHRGPITSEFSKKMKSCFTHKFSETFIVKSIRGNKGLGTILIQGHTSLFSLLETQWAMNDQEFLISPYIPATEEWRLLMIGGHWQGALLKKKKKGGDFRANFQRLEQKASYWPVQRWPKHLQQLALQLSEKIVEKTQAIPELIAVDVLQMNKKLFLLEINTTPGLEQWYQQSPLDPVHLWIEYLHQ